MLRNNTLLLFIDYFIHYKVRLLVMFLIILACGAAFNGVPGMALAQLPPKSGKIALLLKIEGVIGPATQDYLHRGLQLAQQRHAVIVILQMDTPGGLDQAMRSMVADILASPIAVAAYVAPDGARAASAGTYLLYASHIAAMAPATHLGAATPINLMQRERSPSSDQNSQSQSGTLSTEQQKTINDAKAYIRSLAKLRGRNAQWAEQAVTQAATLSANEALQLKVIDLIAPDEAALLAQIDSRKVLVQNQVFTLNTAHAQVQMVLPDWRTRFLQTLTNPSVAYLLLLLGFYGLLFEFLNPGFVLPGVVGGIALLIALYAFQLLSVNYAGLLLVLFGLLLIIGEAFAPGYGVLGIGGMIGLIIGSIFLFKPNTLGFGLPISLIVTMTLLTGLFMLAMLQLAWRSHRRPVVSGREWMMGQIGEVVSVEPEGTAWVLLLGEHWQAQSSVPLQPHQRVRVIAVSGLMLEVEPCIDTEKLS